MKISTGPEKVIEFGKKAVYLKLYKAKYILLSAANLIISKILQQKNSYPKEIPLHFIFYILFNEKGW